MSKSLNNQHLTNSQPDGEMMEDNRPEVMMELDNTIPRRHKQANDQIGIKRELSFHQSESSQEQDNLYQLSLTRRRQTKIPKSNSRYSLSSVESKSSGKSLSKHILHKFDSGNFYHKREHHQPSFLKPLYFEVPSLSPHQLIGRQWVFMEISNHFHSNLPICSRRGVVITGGPGSGKTSIVLSLVENSCFGKGTTSHGKEPSITSQMRLSQVGDLLEDHLSHMARHVVAYHFCQADNSPTCLIPEFIQSIAAQMSQAPQLNAFFHLIQSDPELQKKLSFANCNANPSDAFTYGILEPLGLLGREGKISQTEDYLIVIDALCEAEQHRPEYGDTLASFISKHLDKFPPWLKILVTLRETSMDVTKDMPFHIVCLDNTGVDERPNKDISDYIVSRVNSPDSHILPNISHNKIGDGDTVNKLASYLITKAHGCFLYVKLILDQIEKGILVIKSGTFKVLPRTLSEIYQLAFNKKFPTSQSYEQVKDILSICLASLQPVNLPELFNILSSLTLNVDIGWDEFKERYQSISDILITRRDGSVMLFHPTLRDWLLAGRSVISNRFKCDLRAGHAAIVFYLTRHSRTLMIGRTIELVHHSLKANLLRNISIKSGLNDRTGLSHKDIQALFVSISINDISAAMGCIKNIFSPILKVSQVLLLAGADPNYVTEYMDQCPLLGIYSYFGNLEMVSLLLEFSAKVDKPNQNGETALSLSCKANHMDIIQLLLQCGAVINRINPVNQTCPLFIAAQSGHLNVVEHLLAQDWPKKDISEYLDISDVVEREEAVLQAVNAAICHKQFNVSEILLDLPYIHINSFDNLTGLTPLCAAAKSGDKSGLELILKRQPNLSQCDINGQVAIHIGARDGHWDIVDCLLQVGADVNQIDGMGRTPLMMAAGHDHSGVMELLMLHGAHLEIEDKEGITPLNHAVISGHLEAVASLLNKGANINYLDKCGRSPLDLAVCIGKEEMVGFLLDNGAGMEKADEHGIRVIDRAIGFNNAAVLAVFLKNGARLVPSTWTMANGKPEIMLLLLNKLLDDGNILFRKNQLSEAAHRYRYALKHMSSNFESVLQLHAQTFSQLQLHLLLNLSRCERRQGRPDVAIQLASQAIASQEGEQTDVDGMVDALVTRGKAFKLAGKLQEAAHDFSHALEMAPGNKDISRAIARLRGDNNKENQILKLPNSKKLCDLYGSVESMLLADVKSTGAGSI